MPTLSSRNRINEKSILYDTHIIQHVSLTSRIHKILLNKPINFKHCAGQYIKLYIENGSYKFFSIANAPHSEQIELHIQSPYLISDPNPFLSNLLACNRIRISKSLGNCILPKVLKRAIIFIAGGCGFAQIKSLLEDLSMRANVIFPVYLYWGVQSYSDAYYLKELRDLMRNNHWFHCDIILNSSSNNEKYVRIGYPTDFVFKDFPDLSNFDLYVSGPEIMVKTAYHLANKHRVCLEHFYTDCDIHKLKNE